jgi:glucose-specific phosphotransferase system IIA component
LLTKFKFKKQILPIYAPVDGKIISLQAVNDDAFQLMGPGFAIIPTSESFYSPFPGKLEVLFPTGHAFVISNYNIKCLMHIGINTVQLKGKGFAINPNRSVLQLLSQKDQLVKVDLSFITQQDYPTTTVIVFIDNSVIPSQLHLFIDNNTSVKQGELIGEIKL